MRICSYFFAIFLLSLAGCGKQNKKPLAHNWFEQSSLEAENQHYQQALQLVNKSLSVKSTPQALAHKATLLYQLHDYEGSLALFEKIINHKDTSDSLRADTKNNYACLLNQLGRQEKAKKMWLELTRDTGYITPEVAFFNLGLLALMHKQLPEAIEYLTSASQASPDYVDAFYYLAITYVQMRDFTNARKNAQTVLSLIPAHAAAKELITYLDTQCASNPA